MVRVFVFIGAYSSRSLDNVSSIGLLTHEASHTIYHISNVNGVLQYTRITALYRFGQLSMRVKSKLMQLVWLSNMGH